MKKLIIAAILFSGALFLLGMLLGQSPNRRNLEYFPDMARSFAYKAQSPNPFFANGVTQQPPVEGTIARGVMPLHFGDSIDESVRAGNELQNPISPGNEQDMKRGQAIYQTFCQVCHGAGGQGDGPVAKRGYPPPPSLLLGNSRNMKDGQIFHIITYGFKNMPAYASQIEREDRWRAISYIRKLQEQSQ